MTQFSAPVAAAFGDATEKWGITNGKDQTAFNIAMETDVSFFDYFAKSTELSSTFASYMRSVQSSYGTSLNHLLTGFDWAGLGEAVVVDVGHRRDVGCSYWKNADVIHRLVDPLVAPVLRSRRLFLAYGSWSRTSRAQSLTVCYLDFPKFKVYALALKPTISSLHSPSKAQMSISSG